MDQEIPMEENSEEKEQTPNLIEKFMSARLANIFFIIISVALVVGVFLSFWANNQFDLISQPLLGEVEEGFVTEEETQQWKTYTDYDYFFSIDYPENWDFSVRDSENEQLRSVFFFTNKEESPERGLVLNIVREEDFVNKLRSGTFLTIVDRIESMKDLNLFNSPDFLTEESFISETNIYSFLGDNVFNFRLDLEPEATLTHELKLVYEEIYDSMIQSFEYNREEATPDCRPTGCSSQICSDEEVTTTCEYSEAFACYENAVCERQSTGECGWTLTDNLKQCLRSAAGVQGANTQENNE